MTTLVPARDWHGLTRQYFRADGVVGNSLLALARADPRLDPAGIRAALSGGKESSRTIFAAVAQLPCGQGWPELESAETFPEALFAEVARIADEATRPALAISGGLDAAVVLHAWRETGRPLPAVCTLATGLAGYDEVSGATRIAKRVGAPLEIVSVTTDDLAELLPEAVRATEATIYNHHPVTRLAFARALRSRGFETLVTGDGADAIFRGKADWDYVPLMASLTEAAGLSLRSPFFAEPVIATALRAAPDPAKQALRSYAMSLGVSGETLAAPKRPRTLPPLRLPESPPLDEALHRLVAGALPWNSADPRHAVAFASITELCREVRRS